MSTLRDYRKAELSFNADPSWVNEVRCILCRHELSETRVFKIDITTVPQTKRDISMTVAWLEKVCSAFDKIQGYHQAKQDYLVHLKLMSSRHKPFRI